MANPIDTYKQVNVSQEVSQYRAVQSYVNKKGGLEGRTQASSSAEDIWPSP